MHTVDATDLVAVIHARLRPLTSEDALGFDAWLHEDQHTNRTDLQDMISQLRNLAAQRMQILKLRAMAGDETWTRKLTEGLPASTSPLNRSSLVEWVAIYRDRWLIGSDPNPLGPPPADYEWEQARDRRQIESEIECLQNFGKATTAETAPQISTGTPLTRVGLEI